MRIAGAFEENEARGCSGFAPSMRNAVSLMLTKPGVCDALTCAATPTSTSACVFTARAFNLGLLMRKLTGRGTPRGFHGLLSVFGAGADRLKSVLEFFSRMRRCLKLLRYPFRARLLYMGISLQWSV